MNGVTTGPSCTCNDIFFNIFFIVLIVSMLLSVTLIRLKEIDAEMHNAHKKEDGNEKEDKDNKDLGKLNGPASFLRNSVKNNKEDK